jgi:RNA polymerase sigma-B factor
MVHDDSEKDVRRRRAHGEQAFPQDGASERGPAGAARRHSEREALIERHLGLARHLALRYRDRGEPIDDLIQVASLGLLKAADRFDPSRGVAFATFAVPTILGELRRHFRDRGWALHVPRDLKEAALRVTRALRACGGRAPTPAELARVTGLSLEQVVEALEVAGAHHTLSLDAPVGEEDDGGATVLDQLGAPDDGLARARDRVTLAGLVHVLDAREREILRLRFEEDLTQSEIGARVGVSQMQVSRILRAALARMREVALEAERPADPAAER